MTMTNYERMLAGLPHYGFDEDLFALQAKGAALKAQVDAIPAEQREERFAALSALFGSTKGYCLVLPPFQVDYGCHIHLGEWVFVNRGSMWLDSAPITLGDRCAIGPNVQFIATGHPVRPEDRFHPAPEGAFPPFNIINTSGAITLGREVWVGAGAIILQGVTIGDGAVIGAGSVVTKSVPPRVVAVGNPARVVKSVDD
jgi:maltose O-acetyltransferase